MTNEQINQAIAEACGWTEISSDGVTGKAPGETCNRVMFMPLYCTNLNAMHEAEKVLAEIQWFYYLNELYNVVRLPNQPELQMKQAVNATARQRAEALLRTLGKWEEGE
jgi:hypothetical protein